MVGFDARTPSFLVVWNRTPARVIVATHSVFLPITSAHSATPRSRTSFWTTTPAVCVWRGGSGGGELKKKLPHFMWGRKTGGEQKENAIIFFRGGHMEFLIEFPAS